MEKQENIERYYIEIIEMFSKKHQMSVDEVLELFSNHFIYESIVSCADSWGHFNFEENLEYVENIIFSDKNKQMILYHGSIYSFDKIDLNKSKGNRDFGNGFYTTVMYNQAFNWANNLSKRYKRNNKYIYSFIYDLSNVEDLNIKSFTSINEEWFDFVCMNRKTNSLSHKYDIVSGPVADDDVNVALTLYESKQISKDDALNRLTYKKVSNQISFHTNKALEYLTLYEKEDLIDE